MKICRNCDFQNDDASVYCSKCGTLLESSGTYGNNYYQSYNTPPSYSTQSYGYQPIEKPKPSKTKVIVLLIFGALFSGPLSLPALVLAILALLEYTKYTQAVQQGNYVIASQATKDVNKYYKYGKICAIIGIILTVIGILLTVSIFIFSVIADPEVMAEIEGILNEDTEIIAAAINLMSNFNLFKI